MIRIIQDHETEDGYLFWTGDTFNAMNDPQPGDDAEVKTAGEYVWIPGNVIEVIPDNA